MQSLKFYEVFMQQAHTWFVYCSLHCSLTYICFTRKLFFFWNICRMFSLVFPIRIFMSIPVKHHPDLGIAHGSIAKKYIYQYILVYILHIYIPVICEFYFKCNRILAKQIWSVVLGVVPPCHKMKWQYSNAVSSLSGEITMLLTGFYSAVWEFSGQLNFQWTGTILALGQPRICPTPQAVHYLLN